MWLGLGGRGGGGEDSAIVVVVVRVIDIWFSPTFFFRERERERTGNPCGNFWIFKAEI
jgi:hypothetical protein